MADRFIAVFDFISEFPLPTIAFLFILFVSIVSFISFDYLFFAIFSSLCTDLGFYGKFHEHLNYGVVNFAPPVGDICERFMRWLFWQEHARNGGVANGPPGLNEDVYQKG
jgi:hypothetical protein